MSFFSLHLSKSLFLPFQFKIYFILFAPSVPIQKFNWNLKAFSIQLRMAQNPAKRKYFSVSFNLYI